MSVTIKGLRSKYYGTEIDFGDGLGGVMFTCSGDEPSDRQLKDWGITREQWDTNALVGEEYTGWFGPEPCRSLYGRSLYACDSHWENSNTFEIAVVIATAVSQWKKKKGIG